MNTTDLEARLHDLPPELRHPHDRFEQIEGRVRRQRTRRRIGAAAVGVAVLAIAVPLAMQSGSDAGGDSREVTGPSVATQSATPPPGADTTVPLDTPRTTEGTGSSAIDLGERPTGANAVSVDLTCLSQGTFRWPDGASLTCNAQDAAQADSRPTTSEYVIDLEPMQTQIQIRAQAGASWQLRTTYVRIEHTDWGITPAGESYGVPNDSGTPDLIAFGEPEGEITYIRSEDLDDGVSNPDEALAWMQEGNAYAVPTYGEDGVTILGTYERSEEPDPSAIPLTIGSAPAGAESGEVTGLLTVTDDGCVHLDTPTGKRWLILPWGVQLAGSPDDGQLQTFTGDEVAVLNREATFSGEEVTDQRADVPCGTDQSPFYVTVP